MAVNAVQQYCLRWNNHLPNFLSMFSRLLGTEALVDVTLAAGGRTIQAHRIVLAACSSYFEEIFQANPCQHPVVILKDIGFEDLRAIVEFMYYGEVHVSQANLQTVIQAADTLRVKGLTDPPSHPHTFTSATKRNANPTTVNRPPSPRRRKKSRRLSADASLSTERSEEATTSLESRENEPSSGTLNSMLSQQSSLGEEDNFNAAIVATETVVEGESGVETSNQPSNEGLASVTQVAVTWMDSEQLKTNETTSDEVTQGRHRAPRTKKSKSFPTFTESSLTPLAPTAFNRRSSFLHAIAYPARRYSNFREDENFEKALNDIRTGIMGFGKAAKYYGFSSNTLWREYHRRGLPLQNPAYKRKKVAKEETEEAEGASGEGEETAEATDLTGEGEETHEEIVAEVEDEPQVDGMGDIIEKLPEEGVTYMDAEAVAETVDVA